jgi:enoyl-CoA hydratase
MPVVVFGRRGAVGVITLNRPEKRNAINPEMSEAIEDCLDQIESDASLRVGVLRANVREPGPVFCAGHDLGGLAAELAGNGSTETARGGFAGMVRYERTKPLIAAVDGLATSGGLEIVLACDLVVASSRSSFALAEVKWGLVAGAGGLFRLPRVVGRNVAMQLALTGAPIDARRAYDLGLVNVLVETQPGEAAIELAESVARNGALAVTQSRQLVDGAFDRTDSESWAASKAAISAISHSEELSAGLTAFRSRKQAR